MTVRRGLFVRKDDERGTSPVEARLALAGMFESTGILSGGAVTGTTGWNYSVAAFTVVSSRTPADGVVLFANDAPELVPTDAAPATGSRIDIIYAKHDDVDNGDASSAAAAAVLSSEASGTPVPPVLPDGAVELARATVGAGATNTAHANVTISRSEVRSAAPHSGMMRFASTTDRDAAIPTPVDGMICRTGSGATMRFWACRNGAWADMLAVIGADTGWVSCAVESGFTGGASVRRRGPICELALNLNGSIPVGSSTVVATLPDPEFYPDGTTAARLSAYFAGGFTGVAYVTNAGVVGVTNDSGAVRSGAQVRGTWGRA